MATTVQRIEKGVRIQIAEVLVQLHTTRLLLGVVVVVVDLPQSV